MLQVHFQLFTLKSCQEHNLKIWKFILGTKEGLSCEECNFWTLHPRELKDHVAFDHKGTRYPCDNCEYRATTKSYLKKHKQSKHEGIRFPCDDCEYSATSKYLLKKHCERDHISSSNQSKDKDLYQSSVGKQKQYFKRKKTPERKLL